MTVETEPGGIFATRDLRSDNAGRDDAFKWVDHLSRYSGLAVAQLYLIAALLTVYDVFARYVLNAPTQWGSEIVMVLCAVAWMISAGYVTLKKRHIGITVFYLMASDRGKWRLDFFAYVVGALALFLLADDQLPRALESIDLREKFGSAFNSPQPMVLKTVLVVGALIYLTQLMVNLWRHVESRWGKGIVLAIAVGMIINCVR